MEPKKLGFKYFFLYTCKINQTNNIMNDRNYKIDLQHLFSREKVTLELGYSRTEANEKWKEVKKNFSILWYSSMIYC